MKKFVMTVALAATAFAAHADPSFSLSGQVGGSISLSTWPGYDGPTALPYNTPVVTANVNVVGGPGFVTFQYIGAEASFMNRNFNNSSGVGAPLFTTPGVGGSFVMCATDCTSGPFMVSTGTLPFSFTSPIGSVANGSNSAIEPNFGVFLTNSNTVAYLFFNDAGNGPDRDYDDMIIRATITAVPEPSTYAMLLAGLGILFGIMRRRS